jgi:hypothetical protein
MVVTMRHLAGGKDGWQRAKVGIVADQPRFPGSAKVTDVFWATARDDAPLAGQDSRRSRTMKYISLIAVAASALVVGCTVATSERVVEKPATVSERTVVYTDPAPVTTTVYTR